MRNILRFVLVIGTVVVAFGVRGHLLESQAQSINVASLGIVKFSDGIACQKKKAGRVVKKKVKKVTKETFVNLTKYYKDKNKGRSLSSKQVKSVKAADLRCKRLGVVENLYVDLGLKKSCTSKSYSVTNRSCKGKDGYGYKTIKEALLAIGPGDRLILRGGNYNTPIKIAVSGLSNSALVITNQTNEAAIIQGLPQGILINANYITIEGLTFSGQSGAGSAGIQVNSGLGIDITNNLFSGIQGDGVVLAAGVKETLVSRNVFHHVGGTAIGSVDHGGDVMQYNAIFQSGSGIRLGQLGGTYVAPSLVHHNIVVRNSGIGVGAALPNGPGDNSLVLNNTVVGNGASGLQIDGTGHSLIVKNNIILGNQIADLNQGNSAGLNIDFNLFGAGQAAGLHAFESAFQLPLILSDGNSNSLIDVFDALTGVSLASEAVVRVNSAVLQGFSLGADSVAINAGVDTGFNAADFVGAAVNALVDLGALEFTGVSAGFVAGPGIVPNPSSSPIASPSPSPSAVPSAAPSPVPSIAPSPSSSINPSFVGFNQPPPLNLSIPTSMAESTEFLYTGTNPVQTGVLPGTIEVKRVAVVRGKVVDPSGSPISGVTIKVLDHPELGQTVSRVDGWYDMAVNGGGLLTMDYSMTGYVSVQRQVQSPWRDYVIADDVKLTMLDSAVTQINLATQNTMMAHQGTVVTDADGTRQAAILIPTGTTANLVLPNGTTQPITNVSIRATEFTVGPDGPMAMPGTLPPTSGYTYALELSVDEAIAAGAKEVTFNQALPFYVDNFLNFPVGMIVPAGYYDRTRGIWVPSDNGKVVKIVSINAGQAVISIDPNNNTPASSAELTTLGVTTAELIKLGAMYTAGKTLWRVPIKHFTPWDLNWPYGPPSDATAPSLPPPKNQQEDNPDDPCLQAGSIIECENRVLREEIPLVGTPFTLNYSSAGSRLVGQKLKIPLSGASLPSSLTRIDLKIEVAGRTVFQSFAPQTNLTHVYVWDGLDVSGRKVNGSVRAKVGVGYAYNAVYMQPSSVGQAFGALSGVPLSANSARTEVVLWQNSESTLGSFDDKGLGFGGWRISPLGTYDAGAGKLQVENKTRSGQVAIEGVIERIAGLPGSFTAPSGSIPSWGDGGSALLAELRNASGLAVSADGSVVFAANHRIRKIATDGIISTIAGNGSPYNGGYSGDGGPALQAALKGPGRVAIGVDGSVYFSDQNSSRVRRISTNGIINTIAGNGSLTGDGVPAMQAATIGVYAIAVGADDNIYLSTYSPLSGTHHIRRISPSGIITTIAGNGVPGFSGDGGPALQASLTVPSGLAVDSDGSIYFTDLWNHRVRRVSPNGTINTVVGTGSPGFGGDGGLATAAQLYGPANLSIGLDGSIFIWDEYNHRIRRVSRSGIINTVAGNGIPGVPSNILSQGSYSGDGGPATQAHITLSFGLAVAPDRALIFSNWVTLRRVYHPLSPLNIGETGIASPNGERLYQFDNLGRHVSTRNTLLGLIEFSFIYDLDGRLSQVADAHNQITTLNYDSNGHPTSIVAPFGQTTTFTVDSNGYLASATNPNNETYSFTYSADGLLQSMLKPNDNLPYVFSYDTDGRLVSDSEPASTGGVQNFSETTAASLSGFTVQRTTSLNRQTSYLVERLSTNDIHRRITLPDGTFHDRVQGTESSDHSVSSDGTVRDILYGPDPRFQMQSPIVKTFSITTPGNLVLNGSSTRNATLATTSDLFSLQSLTDTSTLNGKTSTKLFSKATNTYTYTTPTGRQASEVISPLGETVQIAIPNFDNLDISYDSAGRIDSLSLGTGSAQRLTSFTYDSSTGYLQSMLDPLQRQFLFQQDPVGRITAVTFPDGRILQLAYDANGNLISLTPPGRPAHVFAYTAIDQGADYIPPVVAGSGGNMTSFNYNLDRQLSLFTRPDGQQVSFNYGATTGKLLTEVSPLGTKTYSYNATTGKLSSVTGPYGENLAYTYDGMLPTQTTWSGPVAGSVQKIYNNDLRVSALKVNNANAVNLGYDNDGLLTSAGALTLTRNVQNGVLTGTTLGTPPTQLVDTLSYSSFAELANYAASFSGNQIYSEQITSRDKLGRIVDRTEVVQGTTTTYHYDYDLAGRLYQVTRDGVIISTYTYDTNGNRIGANTTAATYDDQDRLLTYGTTSFAYTANGELSSKTTPADTTSYVYDVYGSLISVNSSTLDIDYVIDSAGRRVGKKVNNVLQKGWLYQDKLRPIAELNSTGSVVSRFVYAAKVNVPDYMIKNGVTYRIVSDHLGSVRLVVNMTNGAIAQRMDFDEFGVVTQDTNPGFQPFGFAGGLYDPDTKLVRFGARDYDPEIGRWTSKDPIGFAGADTSLYGYVLANPIDDIDPSGLCGLPCVIGIGAAALVAYQAWNYFTDAMNILKEEKLIQDEFSKVAELDSYCNTLDIDDPRRYEAERKAFEARMGMHDNLNSYSAALMKVPTTSINPTTGVDPIYGGLVKKGIEKAVDKALPIR